LTGDTQATAYQISKSIFLSFLEGYTNSVGGIQSAGGITTLFTSINSKTTTVFASIVPGLFVFALILQISMLGSLLTSEYEKHTLNRIILSPIDPLTYLIAVTLFQLTITTIQFPFMVFTAQLFGFTTQGSYLLAYIVLLLTTFSVIGFAFFIGATLQHPDTAGMLGGLISAPLGFISGAFIPVPPIVLIPNIFPTAGGNLRDFSLYDLLPTTHAVNALNGILLHNYSIVDVLIDISSMLVLSLILFFIGGLYFTRQRLMRASQG
ncbi:MAG: ABC transporter permease, partial [Candidatus Thorarchaeota archaeon]